MKSKPYLERLRIFIGNYEEKDNSLFTLGKKAPIKLLVDNCSETLNEENMNKLINELKSWENEFLEFYIQNKSLDCKSELLEEYGPYSNCFWSNVDPLICKMLGMVFGLCFIGGLQLTRIPSPPEELWEMILKTLGSLDPQHPKIDPETDKSKTDLSKNQNYKKWLEEEISTNFNMYFIYLPKKI